MGQQVAHGDRPLGRAKARRSGGGEAFEYLRSGELRQILGRIVIEVDAALLDQLHAGGRGEGLGHRQQPEHGVGRHWRTGGDVRFAEGALVHDAVADCRHGDNAGDVVAGNTAMQDGVDLARVPKDCGRARRGANGADGIKRQKPTQQASVLDNGSARHSAHDWLPSRTRERDVWLFFPRWHYDGADLRCAMR